MTEQQFQRFRQGNALEKVCVRATRFSTNNNSTPSYHVSLEDIRDVFPQAIRFELNEGPVPFLLGPDEKRIEPPCIAFYPNDVIEVITASPQPTTVVDSPTIMDLDIRSPQYHLLSSPNLLLPFNSSHDANEFKQVEANDSKMKALQLEAKEKDERMALLQKQMLELQNQTLDLQNQALDKPAVLQKHAHAIFARNSELHECPIPRLFIILPVDTTTWNSTRVLENKFRLHFLCEFGDHTMEESKSNENQIHIARHEGYEIKNDTEFYKKYGKYMLILMRALKMGMKSTDISIPHIPLPTLLNAGIDFSIEYMEALSKDNPALKNIDTIDDYEGLEEADLQHLDTFLRINDQNKELGGLYRTAAKTGRFKWACNEHYRLTYKEREQKVFAMSVAISGGKYDWRLGKVSIILGSKTRAHEFFDALAKARHVYNLDIKFDWECSMSDIGAFGEALRVSSVSILRLDLQQFRPSVPSTLLSTPTQYNMLVPIIEHANMKTIHIVLSMGSIKLCNMQPKRSHLQSLSIVVTPQSIDSSAFPILVTAIKANTALTALDFENKGIWSEEAVALSDALKTNSTLTALNLTNNLIGKDGALALSEVLKTNTGLTTLNLNGNWIGKEGVLALSEALKANTTLTTLDLTNNSIGKEGAIALSEALKTNTTLTTLVLSGNSIGDDGALALSEVLKTKTTLTILQ
ncbi:hypothetical protein BGZ49_003390 [Haplosporangium sp. Z 27]|nr:hypothetical protein BGZ49_003390 [Haplosporangium sp. Z 27]